MHYILTSFVLNPSVLVNRCNNPAWFWLWRKEKVMLHVGHRSTSSLLKLIIIIIASSQTLNVFKFNSIWLQSKDHHVREQEYVYPSDRSRFFFNKIKMSRSCNIQSVRSLATSLFIQYCVCHRGRILLNSLLNLVRFRLLPSWQGMIFGASCYKWQEQVVVC